MSPTWSYRVVPGLVLLLAVALSVPVDGQAAVDVQHLNVRGHRHGQRLVSGSVRREAYRTSYTREIAAHGRNEIVPEVININIEKHEQTRKYTLTSLQL